MKDKDLYLIMCEALKTGGSNTKNNREKKNAEAVKSMVEMVERKCDFSCKNIKEAIKFLTADKESEDDKDDRDHVEDNFFFRQVGLATLMDLHHLQTITAIAAMTAMAQICTKVTMRMMGIRRRRTLTRGTTKSQRRRKRKITGEKMTTTN
jgi:hypothetical protein